MNTQAIAKTFRTLLLWCLAPGALITLQAPAQTKGYLGKKTILKATVINGIRLPVGGALEHVVSRRLSLELFFESINYSRGDKGVKRFTGNIKPRGSYGNYREFSTLKNGTTKGWLAGAGARVYFNRIVPAPYGFYMSFSAGYGHVSMQDYDVSYTYKEKSNSVDVDEISPKPDATGLSNEAPLYLLELPSWGYQRIFRRFIVLDSKIGLQTQYCPLPDNLRNAFEHNYYTRTNTVSYGFGNFSFGLAVYLKIGLLLF